MERSAGLGHFGGHIGAPPVHPVRRGSGWGDGADEDLTVLVEAWAHQGPPKATQKHKVLVDAMRLLFVASTLPVPPRMLLCLSDQEAARHFTTARSWASAALRSFNIGVEVVNLPYELRGEIVAVQQRQYR
jgi:hypothetical protein